jgi:hypothetical protein
MAIGVGSFVRWNVTEKPPPGVDINTNSAMVVLSITTGERGTILRCSRQNGYVGTYPQSIMVEVRAPS